jgi:MFS family permease
MNCARTRLFYADPMESVATVSQGRQQIVQHDRLVLFAGSAGIFLSTLDSGIMNVALPSLCTAFNCDFHAITLTVTLYMATIGSTIVLFGRLADRLGQVVLLGAGFLLFGLASAGCALSTALIALIAWRALQGVGAAMMQASAAAAITTVVRGMPIPIALGIFGTFLGLGPVLGPTVGGVLLSTVGWPWIFWINLPICAAGAYCTFRLSAYARRDRTITISPLRNGSLMIGTICLLFLMQSWSSHEWQMTGILAAVGAAGLAFFVWLESRAVKPVIPRALLKSGRNIAALWIVFCYGVAFAILFLLPPLFFGDHLPSCALADRLHLLLRTARNRIDIAYCGKSDAALWHWPDDDTRFDFFDRGAALDCDRSCHGSLDLATSPSAIRNWVRHLSDPEFKLLDASG